LDKKRVLVIADLHSGHQVGLTPPEFSPPPINHRQERFWKVRAELWEFFRETVDRYRPYDILILNGDAIEGKGERSGGTELITSDRRVQVAIAGAVIKFVNAGAVRLIFGTPSHVGRDEDWEDFLADHANCKIGSHEWFDVNGRIIDCKHKIGSSTIPHGRMTPLMREILWNRIWAARGEQPKADILIRSHAHYYEHCDHDDCLGFITPCLQGYGSKFGSRECSGTIDLGVLMFDVYANGEIVWTKHLAHGQTQKASAEAL
jgi:hypothetical protein